MEIEELRNILGGEFAFIFNEINPVIQSLKLEKTAHILDIGTGMGWMAIILALNDFKVTTGEPEEDKSEYAKKDWLKYAKTAKVDHLITYTPFNAEKMPFEDASFDTIFLLGALHHIDDIDKALKESVRILRKSGIICIFEPNSNLIKIIRQNEHPTHPDAINPRDYAQRLHLSMELIELPFYNTYILRK
ncbi:MAG: class I SAM-dependent methyltransferase [Promethearchaeota archaeon]